MRVMLSNADSHHLQTPARALTSRANEAKSDARTGLAGRKIWLPRVLYDALPWFYLLAGVGAFLATLYINAWFWILPHYVLFSIGCVHLGLLILRRRKTFQRDMPIDEADS